MQTITHWVKGAPWSGSGRRRGKVYNPATGEQSRQVLLASVEDVNAVVETAHEAYRGWSATPPAKRAQVMFRFRELLNTHLNELAALLSSEHGKTLADAKGEIARGIEVVEFACGIPHLLKGEFSEQVADGIDSYGVRQSMGVVAGITPFNFPAMVPLWMYPIALACGNAFVLKPSEKDPSVALRIGELLHEAGLPAGAFNIVNGDKEAVDALLDHPQVEAVSFVGSTAIGETIYRRGTENGKRVQALCGAKNHMVILPDADMAQVADALIGSAYGSAGERCMAISVAVPVGEGTADRLIAALADRVRNLNIAPYTDPASDMGPIISRESLARIHDYIRQGLEAGAELVVDGRDLQIEGHENGWFLGGCLFDNVTPDMAIYTDEIFGPVLSVVRAGSYEEALALVNRHEYGNGAALFTQNGDAARDFCARARIGMVGVNVPIPVPVAYHSFGGWKRSLFGDHHIHGMEGVRFNTRLKTVTTRWPSGIKQGAVFNFHAGSDTRHD